jgi:PEP-CTERM motif
MRKSLFSTIIALTAGSAWGGPIPLPPSPQLTTQALACLDYQTATSTCSGALNGTLQAGTDTLSYTDVASAGFGILHVATSSNFAVTGNQAWSYGNVTFADTLTINSTTMQGQTGTLNLSYFIDGFVYDTGSSTAFLQVVSRVYTDIANPAGPTLQNNVADYTYNPLSPSPTFYSESVPLVFTFTYGSPFELFFSMQASNGTYSVGGGYNTIALTGSGSGFSNFADTLIVNGLQTNDPNATFQSGSGTTYTQAGVVPEPSTMFVCGLALIAIYFCRRFWHLRV